MRHLARHLSRTIADHVETELTALGWTGTAGNFGAQPIAVRNIDPDDPNVPRTANLISVWIQDEGPHMDAELGGLREVEFALETHLWAENPSIASALGSDIKDVLRDLVVAVTDYSQDPPASSPTDQVELDDVHVIRPPGTVTASDFRKNWRIVSALARVYVTE